MIQGYYLKQQLIIELLSNKNLKPPEENFDRTTFVLFPYFKRNGKNTLQAFSKSSRKEGNRCVKM